MIPLPPAAESCLLHARNAATRSWLLETWQQPSGLLTGIPPTILQGESRTFWLQLTKSFAQPKQSGFHVGAMAVDSEGKGYPGANFEWPERGRQQTLHAEQSAVINAWMAGAKDVSELWVSEMPCGHCRQLLLEIPHPLALKIIVVGTTEQPYLLNDLLPHAFQLTPAHPLQWGKAIPDYPDPNSAPKEKASWQQWLEAHAKGSYSGELQTHVLCDPQTSQCVVGIAFESAAHNPGISAESAALSRWQFTPLSARRAILPY